MAEEAKRKTRKQIVAEAMALLEEAMAGIGTERREFIHGIVAGLVKRLSR